LLLAVLSEGLPKLNYPDVPAPPELMAVAADPLVVLPTDDISDLHVQLWSTDRFPDDGQRCQQHQSRRTSGDPGPDAQLPELRERRSAARPGHPERDRSAPG
jgi:hypothetical protein